eukprot:jgi/Chlat1/594/Chrsp103S01028
MAAAAALAASASAFATGQAISVPRRAQHAIAVPAANRRQVTRSEFTLAPPPWDLSALEPHMSKNQLDYHWGKHHRAYVTNLNKQVEGKPEEKQSLEEIIKAGYNGGNLAPTFNNAAQIWNHTFFWESMKPNGGGKPSSALLSAIEKDFGSFDKFKEEFSAAAATQFGSGWAWLVEDGGKLKITKTANAVNPLVSGQKPLLTLDVWEHAYYLDYQNLRPKFIQTFLDSLVSWDAVEKRLNA